MGFTTLKGCAVTCHLYLFVPNPPHPLRREAKGFGKWGSTWVKGFMCHPQDSRSSTNASDIQIVNWNPLQKPLKTPVNPSETYGFLRIFAVSWQIFWWIWGVALSLCGFPCPNLRPTRGSLSEDMIQHTTYSCAGNYVLKEMVSLPVFQSSHARQLAKWAKGLWQPSNSCRSMAQLQSLIFNRWCTHCSLLTPVKRLQKRQQKGQPTPFSPSFRGKNSKNNIIIIIIINNNNKNNNNNNNEKTGFSPPVPSSLGSSHLLALAKAWTPNQAKGKQAKTEQNLGSVDPLDESNWVKLINKIHWDPLGRFFMWI